MALAAFKLLKCTGSAASTETDCAKHPCWLSSDLTSIDTDSYQIQAPLTSGSFTYSYETYLRYECTAAPDNYCQTFKVYGPAAQPDAGDSPGSKLTVMMGTSSSGVTPVGTASSVATTSQHDNYYSVATGLAIGVDPSSATIDAIGEKTDYVVTQLKVAYGVQQGDMETLTMNWSYEEV